MANAEQASGQARNTLYGVARLIIDHVGDAYAGGDQQTAGEMYGVGRRVLLAVGYGTDEVTSAMWTAAVAREKDRMEEEL